MKLSKGRSYLIFWLGQVCLGAVKAKLSDQFCVGLVTDKFYWNTGQPASGSGILQTTPKWNGSQEGWEGRPDWKSWEKIWDSWRQQVVCLGFCYITPWQDSSLLVLRDLEKNLPAVSYQGTSSSGQEDNLKTKKKGLNPSCLLQLPIKIVPTLFLPSDYEHGIHRANFLPANVLLTE